MTEYNEITQKFIDTFREVVNENPDYVYPHLDELSTYDPRSRNGGKVGCFYQAPDRPRCVIGETLYRMEVPVPVVYEGLSAYRVLTKLIPELDPVVKVAANGAQQDQDAGDSWRHALVTFDNTLRDEGL